MSKPAIENTQDVSKDTGKKTAKELMKELLNQRPDKPLNARIIKILPISLAIAPGVFSGMMPGAGGLDEETISCSGGTSWMVFPGSLSASCSPEHCLMRGWSIT